MIASLTPSQVQTLSRSRVTSKTVHNHLAGRGCPSEEKVQQIADVLERRHPTLRERRLELLAAAAAKARPAPSGHQIAPAEAANPATETGTALKPLTRRRPFRRTAILVSSVLLLLCAVLLGVLRVHGAEHPRSARIETPTEGESLASPLVVKGTAVVPAGELLWLLVQPPDGRYYLTGDKRPMHVDDDGTWTSSTVKLGQDERDAGFAYNLWVVAAPTGGSFATTVREHVEGDRHGGFAALDPDAKRLDSVRVTLAKYHGDPAHA